MQQTRFWFLPPRVLPWFTIFFKGKLQFQMGNVIPQPSECSSDIRNIPETSPYVFRHGGLNSSHPAWGMENPARDINTCGYKLPCQQHWLIRIKAKKAANPDLVKCATGLWIWTSAPPSIHTLPPPPKCCPGATVCPMSHCVWCCPLGTNLIA